MRVALVALRAALGLVLATGAALAGDSAGLPPLDSVRLLRQARIAEQEGEIEATLAALRQAVEAYPDLIEPRLALLGFGRRQELPDEEMKRLRETLVGWLEDAERRLQPGTLGYLVDEPDLPAAEQRLILDALLARAAQFPDDTELLDACSAMALRLQEYELARELFGRLAELRPSRSVTWMCIELDRRLDRWDQVVDELASLLEEEGEDPGYWLPMSYVEALGKTGRYEELTQYLDKLTAGLTPVEAESLQPSLHQLLLQAAWDLRDRGAFDDSERIFRRLVEADPGNAEARAAVAYLYATEQEVREQEQALARQQVTEEDPYVLLDRGSNLLAAGDAGGALEPLRRATEALPGSEIAWFNLGLAAFQTQDWSLAESALDRSIGINPRRAIAHLNRGAALSELERCEEAITVLRQALAVQPDLYQAHYYLYRCYGALQRVDDAREALERYNALRPGS